MVQPATPSPRRARPSRRRARLGADLTVLAIVGAFLIAAIATGALALHQQFYSPAAFVGRYLDLLATGRAADALRLPGVLIPRTALSEAGLESDPSEALLRRAALAPLQDIEVVGTRVQDEVSEVTVRYRANGHEGTSAFRVVQDGWIGVVPNWRFAQSPLAVIDLVVRGSDRFEVNGFEIDRRQVSPAGMEASPLDPLPLLVFTPGAYSVTVDTPITASPGVVVLADTPLALTAVDVQAEPTPAFLEVVQERVEEFLLACAAQEVLMPTGCPFGIQISDRVANPPRWSIVEQPTVTLATGEAGDDWDIAPARALARVEVEVRSLFDGTLEEFVEDVPFGVGGTVTILPDGTASIRVGAAELD